MRTARSRHLSLSRHPLCGGATVCAYLDHRLAGTSVSAGTSGLPAWLVRLLAQPTLILGAFMVLVVLAPNDSGPGFVATRSGQATLMAS
jgi:hypothetical protein